MPDDAVARAKQAIFTMLAEWFCPGCEHRKGMFCYADNCKIPIKHKQAEDIARAVLEAAGYDKLQAVTEAARNFLQNCRVMDCFLYGDVDPDACMTVETCWKERLKAALQRAEGGNSNE